MIKIPYKPELLTEQMIATFEREGWAIFYGDTVQRITDPKGWGLPYKTPLLFNDDEARELAKKHGFVFEDKEYPYSITHVVISNKPEPKKTGLQYLKLEHDITVYESFEVLTNPRPKGEQDRYTILGKIKDTETVESHLVGCSQEVGEAYDANTAEYTVASLNGLRRRVVI